MTHYRESFGDYGNHDLPGNVGDGSYYQDVAPRRPVYYHNPKTQQQQQQTYHPQSNVQTNEIYEGEPLKELRTYKRNGTELTEEYERLNPDGTVTKTVTVGDKKSGLKHYSVYKMDKSGIIRKIDNPDPNKYKPLSKTEENYAWLDFLKTMEAERMKRNQQQNLEKNIKDSMPNNRYDPYDPEEGQMIYYPNQNSKNFKALTQLTQEERDAVFNDYKEKVLHYGTKRLKKNLENKLQSDKYKNENLTEEQKQTLIDYGVSKLQQLLEKNMNEQKDLVEFQLVNKDDFPLPEEYLKPRKPPVAFNIDPNNKNQKNLSEKPVSFGIRPEYKISTNATAGTPKTLDEQKESMFDRFKTFWKDKVMSKDKNEIKETKPDPKYEVDKDDCYEEDDIDLTINKVRKALKKYLQNDRTYEDSPRQRERKREVVQYALDGMESILRDCQDKKRLKELIQDAKAFNDELGESDTEEMNDWKIKSNKQKSSKRYSIEDENDEDEYTDYDYKAMKKLMKKEKQKKEDKDHKYDSKNQKGSDYDSENGENRTLEKTSKKENKSDKWWDWSSIFGENKDEKKHKSEKSEKAKKELDFDSFLQQIRNTLSLDTDKDSSSKKLQPNSQSKRVISYDSDINEKQTSEKRLKSKEGKGVSFDTILTKIQDAQNKRKTNYNYSTNSDQNQYKDQNQTTANAGKRSAQGDGPKSYVDSLLDKIRETMRLVPDDHTEPTPKNINDPDGQVSYHSTSNTNLGQSNPFKQDNNGMSFHIKPQIFGSGKFFEPSKKGSNSGVEKITSNTGFVPWWFTGTPEPPIAAENGADFPGNVLNDSFFSSPLLT